MQQDAPGPCQVQKVSLHRIRSTLGMDAASNQEEASIFKEEVVIVPLALISWTEPLKQLALLPKLRRSTALPQAIQAHEAVHEARVNVLS